MRKIAILDDEQIQVDLINDFIFKYEQMYNLKFEKYCFNDEKEFLEKAEEKNFDIVFLDIYMSNINGIKIAKQLREKNLDTLIIFSTSSLEYGIESYKVRAFDYLLKPIKYEDIEKTLNLCCKELKYKLSSIRIKEGRLWIDILVDKILYLDYRNHYVYFHTEKRVIKSYMFFKEAMKMLEMYDQFLYCYRNCLVNMDYIETLKKLDFKLTTGELVPISKLNNLSIKQKYANYEFKKLNNIYKN